MSYIALLVKVHKQSKADSIRLSVNISTQYHIAIHWDNIISLAKGAASLRMCSKPLSALIDDYMPSLSCFALLKGTLIIINWRIIIENIMN